MPATVKVSWYCGMFIGPPKWQRGIDWTYEPDECSGELVTEELFSDWVEGSCQAVCPECGAILYQSDGHGEVQDA